MEVDNIVEDDVISQETHPSTMHEKKLPISHLPTSIIGEGVLIKGDIGAKEDICINGRIEGTVAVKHHCVEVGPTADVNANIFAKVVVISGVIKGDIFASERIRIMPSGRITGSIHSVDVCIEDGAILNGKIDMEKQDNFQQAIPDMPDDTQNKSAFNFLFKKQRDVVRLENESSAVSEQTHTVEPVDPEIMKNGVSTSFNPSEQRSLIGESMMVKGEIYSDEDIVIQGGIDGVICVKNNVLLLGPHALLKANIFAKTIITQGEIKGDIYSSEQVVLKKSSQITGNLHSPRVSIQSGALLLGSVTMEAQDLDKAFVDVAEANNSREELLPLDAADAETKGRKATKESRDKEQPWPIFYPRS